MIKTDYIHTDSETGLEYIQGKDKVLFANGVMLTLAELEANRGNIGNIVRERRLDESASGYDYAYAKTTGVIRKKAYHPKGPIKQTEPVLKPHAVEVKVPKVPMKVHKKEPVTPRIIIAVMTIVGILSAFMSAYHTAQALQIMGRGVVIGWITGTVMILFSATAFTAARYFINRKGVALFFGMLFGMLGIVVVLYSMFSTLTVNYTEYRKVSDVTVAEATKNSSTVNAYDAKAALLSKRIENYNNTLQTLEKDAEYWKTMSWKRHDEIQIQMQDIRNKLEEAEDELMQLQMKIPEVEAAAEKSIDTVYTFFARIVHMNTELLQFLIQSIPAMFFDIIAPFALSCVFYLSDKKEDKDE